MTAVGDHIKFQSDTGRWHEGRIVHVVSGDTVHLVALSDGTNWPNGDNATVPSKVYFSVDKGTNVDEWQPSAAFAGELAALDDDSGLATTSAMTAAIGSATSGLASTSYVDAAGGGYCAVPGASSSVSLAASTPRRPNTSRPVMVMITGSWSWNLTAIGTQTGSLTLESDANATPTTPIFSPSWSRSISVGVTVGDAAIDPVCMSYIVLPGHYYQVVPTGGATFSVREQVL